MTNAQSIYGSIAMTHKSDTGLAAHARRPRPNMLSLQPNNRPKASRAPATAGQRPTIPTQRADASCHLTSNKLSRGSELRTGDSREKGRLPLLVTRSRLCNTGRALVRMVLKGAGAGKRKVRGRSGLRVIGYEHQPSSSFPRHSSFHQPSNIERPTSNIQHRRGSASIENRASKIVNRGQTKEEEDYE